jgi:hypothetical protein
VQEIIKRDLLITSSLVDSYDWLKNSPPSWKERAMTGFMNTLNRAPWTPDKKIMRGIEFENKVYEYARRAEVPQSTSTEFKEMVNEARGAIIQKKIKKIVTINGQSFCLYGKTDCSFPNIIKDVKTTASFKMSSR